jgi:hypothetical protein
MDIKNIILSLALCLPLTVTASKIKDTETALFANATCYLTFIDNEDDKEIKPFIYNADKTAFKLMQKRYLDMIKSSFSDSDILAMLIKANAKAIAVHQSYHVKGVSESERKEHINTLFTLLEQCRITADSSNEYFSNL